MKSKIIVSLMIIMLLVCNFQYSQAVTETMYARNYYKDNQIGMLAYKQVNAFKLSLADGSILADATVSSNSEVDIEDNMKDIEIVMVLDCSGSMSGGGEDIVRESSKELVDSLFTKLGEDHVKMGILYFNNGLDTGKILGLTNEKDKIKEHLDESYAAGGTYMADSIRTAHTMLTSSGSDPNKTIKIICALSDGGLADERGTIGEFVTAHDSDLFSFFIFAGTPVTEAFVDLANTDSEKHTNFHTDMENLAKTITKGIFRAIHWKIVSQVEPTITYNMNNVGIYPDDDRFIIQADEELLHGATLEIEYLFVFITALDCNHIKIFDFYDKNLGFNTNQKLLTENATNGDFGWKVEEGTLMNDSGEEIAEDIDTHFVKLVLSTVLTPSIVRDENFEPLGNSMDFSLDYNMDEGEENTITLVVGQSNENVTNTDGKISSYRVMIIPPTGVRFISSRDFVLILNTIIVLVSILLMFVCTKDYLKSKKKDRN